jgi:hypothetical protein
MIELSHSLRQEVELTYQHRLALNLKLECNLTTEQRTHQIDTGDQYYGNFIEFIDRAFGLEIMPSATCLECYHRLSVAEIVIGFKRDVNDFTTACPICKNRFQATNLLDRRNGKETQFWCDAQTLKRLPDKEHLEIKEFETLYPEIYYSAIFHFGSLLNAFSRISIRYYKEQLNWQDRSKLFLGQIPDIDVAKVFGVKTSEIRKARVKLRIDEFPSRKSIMPANWKPYISN